MSTDFRQGVPPCPGGTIYTIQAGDTLFALAQRFNTTVQAILAANPGLDPNSLQVGRMICIPGAATPTPCPGFLYTVVAGDTYFSLAQRFNVTVAALIAANPGVNPNALQIGQRICIPAPGPTPTGTPGPCPGSTYVIRAGDTLFSIAARFGTTVAAIVAVNPGINPNQLQIGQVICLPVTVPTGTPGPCPGSTYVIRAGDTLFSIAARFGTTVAAIVAVNPGINPNQLQIGQVICLPVTVPTGTPGPCPGSTYVIRAGDTLFSIAARFGTTVAAIVAVNPGINPNQLQIGQVICLPVTVPTGTPGPCPGSTYVIRAGDTLFSIAARFGTTVAAIVAVNPGINPNQLQIGQVICLP